MPNRNGQQGMVSGLQPINVKFTCYCTLTQSPETLHDQDQWHTPASWGINEIPLVVVGVAALFQGAHQRTKDSVQRGSQYHPSGFTIEVERDRDTILILYRTIVRSKVNYLCIVYGTASNNNVRQLTGATTLARGILHQPSLQYVHGGQRTSIGGMSAETVHALLSENSCLHWQPSTSCATWIWASHTRSVSSEAK